MVRKTWANESNMTNHNNMYASVVREPLSLQGNSNLNHSLPSGVTNLPNKMVKWTTKVSRNSTRKSGTSDSS